jgi:tRNA pseudouridine38-40 synthase
VPTFRFLLEYDGTDFAGFQAQAEGVRTVQGELERAVAAVTGVAASVIGAGRTDAGVHAEAQLASAQIETRLDAVTLQRALNAVLPPDLAVRDLALAATGFRAIRDARSKLYRYRVWNGPVRSPLRDRTHHWVRAYLDLDAMARAASSVVGRHDFASFETRGRENGAHGERGTVRTLHRATVEGEVGAEIRLDFEGDGFLRYMVRSLVGTLLEVGKGERPESALTSILAARDRREAGPTVPAKGLVLLRVEA